MRNFWDLINSNKFKIGIEIGVREGWHSSDLLEQSSLDILFGIDILKQPSVEIVEKNYPTRYKFLETSSEKASKLFDDEYFDFIYIDADHAYESVKNDLSYWWLKLKKGGLICGDDYMDFDCPGECSFGVIQAVEEFVEKNNLTVNILGKDFDSKKDRMEFGIKQGNELNKKIIGQDNELLFNPQWLIYK